MDNILIEQQGPLRLLTLNRVEKHNAFDDALLTTLQTELDAAIEDSETRVILLKSNGKHFSAGADLAWMKRMATFTEEENIADATLLANVMYTLYQSPKPTIAVVQGSAYGGGVGLIAACDIAIAAETAQFCFSEVKLGLVPAVISPYVIQAIGTRMATSLFMSADLFDAKRALTLNLIQHCVDDKDLLSFSLAYASKIAHFPPEAVCEAKTLVRDVSVHQINETLTQMTAIRIAKRRASSEGQAGLHAFLNKD
jgi:methylglutaconyl-CoA hydratase